MATENERDKKSIMRIPYVKLSIVTVVAIAVWLVFLDAKLVSAISGRMWAQPAVIYARPLEIYEGASISSQQLAYELKALGYKKTAKVKQAGQYAQQGMWTLHSHSFQFDDGLQKAQKASFVIRDGVVAAFKSAEPILRLEPLVIGRVSPTHVEDRLLVSLDEVPTPLKSMLVASEDRAFYEHYGISIRGITRALVANLKQQRLSQGGSTLTQQLVKNYFLSAERSLARKIPEIFMSLLLELHLDKDQILENYINEIYLAQNGPRAVHGFGLASQYFFEKSVTDLALHEQALLVALVRGPSYYNPFRNPERATKRRNLMLDLAASQGFVSEAEANQAKRKPLSVVKTTQRKSLRQPAYLDLVKAELRQHYSNEDLSNDGLRVFTHFDPWVQHNAEQAVVNTVTQLGEDQLQAAAVVALPDTGNVIAVVGDRNPRYPGFNRAVDAKRHVGSVIKPAVYLAALQQPQQFNLITAIEDAPLSWPQDDGSIWEPVNFDKTSHGQVPLYQALSRSLNQATARLGQQIGMAAFEKTLADLGLSINQPLFPAALLGAIELSPMDIAQMYQTIASHGFYAELNTVRVVSNDSGVLLSHYPLVFEQRIDNESLALLQFALNRVTIEGSGRSLSYRLPNIAVAGKTGTSNQQRDSWFAGFSGDYLAVTWLGFDDNRPTPFTGASGALKVWAAMLKPIANENIYFPASDELSYMAYDATTAELYTAGCEGPMLVPFIASDSPKATKTCRQPLSIKSLREKVLEWFR